MSKRKTTEQFIQEARAVHGDKYDYSNVEYKNSKTKIKIICKEHGEFWQTPGSHLYGRGCPKCGDKRTIKSHELTAEEFIQRAKRIHNDKYDYSQVNYTGIYNKIKIICPIHGFFEQRPNDHINNKCGCPKCGGSQKRTAEEFIKEAAIIHGNKYDYSKVNYINSKVKVEIVCPSHGSFWQTPNNHLKGASCPICKSSHGERRIRNFLTENKILFEEQKKFDNLYAVKRTGMAFNVFLSYDFFIPEKNLLIEYNGRQHYEAIDYFGGKEQLKKQRHHDWLKRKYARDNNYQLLTISYKDDILTKLKEVL